MDGIDKNTKSECSREINRIENIKHEIYVALPTDRRTKQVDFWHRLTVGLIIE